MGILMGILMVIFIGICLLLIFIILLQSSKGDSLSGIFGGAGMQSFFGGRGAATFLSKLTTGLAIGFILLSLILARWFGVPGSSPELKEKISIEAQEVDIKTQTEKPSIEIETQESQQKTSEEGKKE